MATVLIVWIFIFLCEPSEKYRRDSFSERYAAVTIENCDVPGTQEVEKEQDVYVENEKMENENSPLLLC